MSKIQETTEKIPQSLQLVDHTNHQIIITKSYYRSTAITADSGVNPIVGLAQPLLTLITRLTLLQQTPNLEQLHTDLHHELSIFETRAQNEDYLRENIAIARYLLAATLEEVISSTSWAKDWQEKNMQLAIGQSGVDTRQQFFYIVNQLIQEPKQHIELLELTYLCMSLGFVDPNKNITDADTKIDEISEKVYDFIRGERGDVKKPLFSSKKSMLQATEYIKQFPIWLTVLIATSVLIIMTFAFNYALHINTEPLTKRLDQIIQEQNSQGL